MPVRHIGYVPTGQKPVTHVFQQTQTKLTAVGATGCANSACHGGAKVLPGEEWLGTEYDLWHADGDGVHFGAYAVLISDKRSDRMVKRLYGSDAVGGVINVVTRVPYRIPASHRRALPASAVQISAHA